MKDLFPDVCTSCPELSSFNFCPSFKLRKMQLPAQELLPCCTSRLQPGIAVASGRVPGAASNLTELRGELDGIPLTEAASRHCCNPAKSPFCRNSAVPKTTEQHLCFFSPSCKTLMLPSFALPWPEVYGEPLHGTQ